jgi:hypothetical protein
MPPTTNIVSIKVEDGNIALVNYNHPQQGKTLGAQTVQDLVKAFRLGARQSRDQNHRRLKGGQTLQSRYRSLEKDLYYRTRVWRLLR